MRQITALLALLPFVMPAPLRADIILLKDDNVMEVKVLGQKMHAPNPKEKDVLCVEAEDEKGKKHYWPLTEIKGHFPSKTSWEMRAEAEKWYKDNNSKIDKTWQAQVKFGRDCRTKNLDAEAIAHFKIAHDIREKEPLLDKETEEQRHSKLARWLETDCGLLDEAVTEYARVYNEKVKIVPATAQGYINLAAFCIDHDLDKQAEEEYKKGIAKFPTDGNLKRAYDLFKRSQAIPLNHEMYRNLEGRMAAACKYIRAHQNADGSFGNDAEEAGVQAWRGMTAISAEALLAEWDLKYFADPEKAGACPKEITRAIDFLMTGKVGSGRFAGDDLWGPSLTLQFLVRCYTRPYLADRKYDIELRMAKELELLKKLQRRDGGWNYYNFIPYSASFLTASITINLVAAKNLGFAVDENMIKGGRKFVEATQYGIGTYRYSPGTGESGANTSFSAIGASARSPLCEVSVMAAGASGADNDRSLMRAIQNFIIYEPMLATLRGKSGTHIGKGKTAPYYFMFSHLWTARAMKQLPRGESVAYSRCMYQFIAQWQDPTEGTFHDFTGVRSYKLYATALGALAMHQLVSAEPDPAFRKLEVAQPVVIDPAPKLVLKTSK